MKLFSRKSSPVLDLRHASARRRRRLPKWPFIALAAVIAITGLAGGGYYGYQAWQNSRPTGQQGMEQAVTAVSRLMILPEGETPTYGTVSDKAKLKDQTFFARAQNGDEILIYEKAKLSILYRPSAHKIVNVGPLVIGSAGSPYITSRFAIKNGTTNPELSNKFAAKLKSLYPNAALVSSEQATRAYPATITIDLTKKGAAINEQIADSLKIQAGHIPLGEPEPAGADFLIIIGEDYRP